MYDQNVHGVNIVLYIMYTYLLHKLWVSLDSLPYGGYMTSKYPSPAHMTLAKLN